MANLSRVDQKQWLNLFLTKNESLIEEIVFYKWPSLFDIPKFNCKVSLKINDKHYDGFGIHKDRSICLLIAISEALERYQWQSLKRDQSTNGYANHFCLESATQASLSEIYERDLVLSHFLTKTPYLPLEFNKDILSSWLLKLMEGSDTPFYTSFYQTHSVNHQSSIICMLKHKEPDLGATFGCKSHPNLKKSLESSFLDALSRFHLLFIHHQHSLQETIYNVNNAKKIEIEGPLKYLSAKYLKQIRTLFPTEKSFTLKNDNISLSTNYTLVPDFLSLSTSMFSTFTIEKNKIQDLYKNAPSTMNINMKRLMEFAPNFTPSNINTLDNPFY